MSNYVTRGCNRCGSKFMYEEGQPADQCLSCLTDLFNDPPPLRITIKDPVEIVFVLIPFIGSVFMEDSSEVNAFSLYNEPVLGGVKTAEEVLDYVRAVIIFDESSVEIEKYPWDDSSAVKSSICVITFLDRTEIKAREDDKITLHGGKNVLAKDILPGDTVNCLDGQRRRVTRKE